MSSILKALKKIEGRKVDTSLPAWPYGTGRLESMDSHIHRSRKRQKILGLLIIVCVVALAGKLYIGYRPAAEKTEPETAVSQPSAAAGPEKTAEATQPDAEKTVAAASRSTPAPGPSSREETPETAPPSVASSPPVEEAPSEADTPLVISPSSVEETAAVEEAPAAAFTETFGTPPADKAGLSLMALVWSGQPESRFVVINGTIVREGGSIDESTVVRIEEDYAVMRTGGVTWKLK